MTTDPYGYCPKCGAPGVRRERRPNGNDHCRNGHRYPSGEALEARPSLSPEVAADPDGTMRLQAVAQAVDAFLNPGLKGKGRKVGFVVLMWNWDQQGTADARASYISNGADRRDIVPFLRETAARLEGSAMPESEAKH